MSENTNMATVTSSTTVKACTECCIQSFYRMDDAWGQYTWTDKNPDDFGVASENEMTARYVILVHNRNSFDSRKTLEIESIIFQSPLLKKALNKILKGYPCITPCLRRLVLQESCHAFALAGQNLSTPYRMKIMKRNLIWPFYTKPFKQSLKPSSNLLLA